ncbi:MAG: gamma-glutamyltransferase family protein [Bacillota bacterium]
MTLWDRYYQARFGKSGMVAAAHPLAALAGLNALQEGGNAMDACIVMAGVTSVVLPHMCGLGGDAFFIYYDAKNQRISALNSSGFTGDLATHGFFLGMNNSGTRNTPRMMPQDGILSVAVPGAPMGYEIGLKEFGSFDLKQAFEPAVRLAENGFPVTPSFSRAVFNERYKLEKYPESGKVFLEGGKGPKIGDMFYQHDLAGTLRGFSEGGTEYFYTGPFARQFYRLNDAIAAGTVRGCQDSHTGSSSSSGSWAKGKSTFTGNEFRRFYERPPKFYTPIHVDYRGCTIYQTGPVSQGFLTLEQMKILENFDMPALEPGDPEGIHLMIEAKKLAFRDRNLYAGDPAYSGFDVSGFISAEHTQVLSTLINPLKALSNEELGTRGLDTDIQGDTTFFAVVDGQGNACSFIHSNAFSFGSGLVVPGTGVILNNRAGRSFVLEEGHPNCVAPGKKPMHTLNCYMVFRNGSNTLHGSILERQLYIVGGTPGGDGQPQWNMQMLNLMLDHGFGPQAACDFPRWLSFPGTDVLNLDKPMEVRMESRFSPKTRLALGKLGHSVRSLEPWAGGGGAQIIMLDPDSGLLLGGSDRRLEGMAIGY